jgi:hypothetical protein
MIVNRCGSTSSDAGFLLRTWLVVDSIAADTLDRADAVTPLRRRMNADDVSADGQ